MHTDPFKETDEENSARAKDVGGMFEYLFLVRAERFKFDKHWQLMKNYFTVLFLVATASTIFGQDFGKQVKEFETYTENARKEWQVPGMAVAVVKEGKVIFKKGFGIRQVGTNQLVDTQTIFACASTTKAMTAVCMGMLV
ncbi:MAG: serine hydrolase, partial [Flammeovirgaceae bacterium]